MRIAIIGAGAAGLAAAYDLAAEGHEVVVYESGAVVGGLAAGFTDPAWEWSLEKFYHHWFYTDRDILGLIDEIGKGDKVRFYSPRTSLWHENGIYPLDAPVVKNATLSRTVNVLRLPDLSLIDKIRFGLVGVLLKMYANGLSLEKYTADEWLPRWTGKSAHEMIWRPLLIGKFGPLYDQVNMAWMWARAYKRTAQLGTYVGGFQAMLDDLAEAVTNRGGVIALDSPVEQIVPGQAGGLDIEVNGRREHFDRVMCTTAPNALLKLVPDLPEDYARKVGALRSLGSLALILALDRQLMADGTYWLNLPARSPVKQENPFPFLALVEHTNYLSKEHYGGDHIVYLGDYLPVDHEHFQMSEEELSQRFLASLKQVNPDFSPDWIRKQWLFRAPYSQPVPFVNHSQNIPDIHTPIGGLYFVSMSQVYPWDRGTNYAVELARRAARMMIEEGSEK
ncbi:MAG: NAD(P)/FAD-dependent oxidoreductase [Anaerolineae bacterium]|nr:NAD(P)/FAD-dependent oxidoreductase [Anaerolineae bacterium]